MPKPNEERLHLQLRVRIKGRTLHAMVDSGAQMNAISPEIVNALQLRYKEKERPYRITDVEGNPLAYEGGTVHREIDHLKVNIEGRNQGVDFDIIPIEEHDIILGYPWLKQCNPVFDWHTGQVEAFRGPSASERRHNDTTLDILRSQTSYEEDDEVGKGKQRDTLPTQGEVRPPKGTRQKRQKQQKRQARMTRMTRKIIAYLRQQIVQLDEVTELLRKTEKEDERMRNVPLQYRIYKKLFKEELETGLPKHTEWDLEIEFIDGKRPGFSKIYRLDEAQSQTLKKYLEEMLQKGYIRISKSSAGHPVMFVPKPNTDKLRLVVDYRKLNDITVKDRTPLPLISELKDRLCGMNVFTTLDLKAAYNLIRIKEGHEWKTAFRTKFGLYEYLVMPFGLTNAPAAFQRMITNVLREYLDIFVVCYLDDILIFSKNEEEHTEHVHKTLQALEDANLLVEPAKSKFHAQEVTFLGHEISPGEIRMDRRKLSAIRNWKEPKNVKEVQSFLGFANYYRKFLKNFGKIATPLTNLTRKDATFTWEENAQQAFDEIKDLILSEPVLKMFDPTRPVELETDSSDFALGAQIGQRDDEGRLHPVAFYSHKLHGAELNYPIYDKEFLAIVNAFKEFRHYLRGSQHRVTVYTDHKNISHFAKTQELSRRQLRYAEELSGFDYIIIHRKGSENGRADAISRRPDLDTGKTQIKEQLLHFTPDGHLEQKYIAATWKKPQAKQISNLYKVEQGNPLLRQIQEYNEQLPNSQKTDKQQVPEELRKPLVQQIHEHRLHGHSGINKTLERVKTTYAFPRVRNTVQEVLRECNTCAQIRARRHKPYGLLQPLPVAERPWDSITMDFITKLPLSEDPVTGVHYDSILLIIDTFSKFAHYIPYQENTNAEQFAYIFYDNIVGLHGIPTKILSDRGPPFFSKFWEALTGLLGINRRLTTAFRPQVDGQTERQNQELEQYLRCYVNHEQTNWVELLPTAQLAYNTSYHTSIKTTPAFANFGFTPNAYGEPRNGPLNVKAMLKSEQLKELHEEMKTELEFVRKRMKTYYDQKRIEGPTFQEGDMVYLSTKNLSTNRPNKKLDFKYIGPYRIIQKISKNNYKLDLPQQIRVHPIFHISFLESAKGTIKVATAPNNQLEVESPEEYEPEKIVNSERRGNKTWYLIKWKGYDENENSWEPIEHLAHAQRLLRKFHQRTKELKDQRH